MKKLFSAILMITSLVCSARAMGDDSVIIDVRTMEEWNAGHLATAQLLQLELVAESVGNLVADKDQEVYVYCRSGNRSGQAKTIMESLGYTNVTNAGGLGDASELLAVEVVK